MNQMPRLAPLPRAVSRESWSGALSAEHRRILTQVVTGPRRAAIRPVHRQVTHELRVTEAAALAHVDVTPALGLGTPRRNADWGRERLFSQPGQDCHHEREDEEHDRRRRDDGAMVRV